MFDKKRKLYKTQISTHTSLKSFILWRIYFCDINKSKSENRTFSRQVWRRRWFNLWGGATRPTPCRSYRGGPAATTPDRRTETTTTATTITTTTTITITTAQRLERGRVNTAISSSWAYQVRSEFFLLRKRQYNKVYKEFIVCCHIHNVLY